jgi:excisionase family DNA binding protein
VRPSDRPTLPELLADPALASRIGPEDAPEVLGDLENLRAILWTRLLAGDKGTASPRPDDAALLTMPEVAAVLRVPVSYAYELARTGKLPCLRFGRYVRVEPAALRDWCAEHRPAIRLDMSLCVTHSHNRDGNGGPADPQAARAHSGRSRRADRRHGQQRRPVGARRDRHSRVSGPVAPAPGQAVAAPIPAA